MDKRPIGIFDSGLGGLTVFSEIINEAPHENIIYLGDTARFPYGEKKLEDVKRYSLKIAEFLYNQGIKLLVIACNTATSAALNDIKKRFDIPVIGVVDPGARTAARATANKRVGVIATTGTVLSKAYDKSIEKIDKSIELFSNPAPELVELIEKGILDGDILEKTICKYTGPLFKENIDVLILGCTHFPLIEESVKKCCMQNIKVISSAVETSKEVSAQLLKNKIENSENKLPQRIFYETGNGSKFYSVGSMFLGSRISEVKHVDLKI